VIRRRRAVALALLLMLGVGVAVAISDDSREDRARVGRAARQGVLGQRVQRAPVPPRDRAHRAAGAPGLLAPGSDPSVLPGPVLIADRDNNRVIEVSPQGQVLWRFPAAGDLAPGQTFLVPDDAFYSPDARSVIATCTTPTTRCCCRRATSSRRTS
jgi:hypothetical protein